MTTPSTNSDGLIDWLKDLAESRDRGRLAALRRGLLLEPNQFYELYRVVPARYLDGVSRAEIQRRLATAILFASHPRSFSDEELAERPRNLGESLRRLAVEQAGGSIDPDEGPPEALKRRFDALLAAHVDELFNHLRQIIRLLKSREIPVDWAQLLSDLRNWDNEDRQVQWRWSRSFYVGERRAQETEGEVV
ncbi:MAG TPA: type I-E CRISPR-associated protein Cse2/CasB [Trueperaceae bacterium]